MNGESLNPNPQQLARSIQAPSQTNVSLNASHVMLGNVNIILKNEDRGDTRMNAQIQRETPTLSNHLVTMYPGHSPYQSRHNPSTPITVTTSGPYAVPTPSPHPSGSSVGQREIFPMNVMGPENFARSGYSGASSSLYATPPPMLQNVYVNQAIDPGMYPAPPNCMNQYQVDPMAVRPPIQRRVHNEPVGAENAPLLSELLRTPSYFKTSLSNQQRRRPYQPPGIATPLPSSNRNEPPASRCCSIPGCQAELRGLCQSIRPPSHPVHWDGKSVGVYSTSGSSGQQILRPSHPGGLPLESPVQSCCLNEQAVMNTRSLGQGSYRNQSDTSMLAGNSSYPNFLNEQSGNAGSLGQDSYHNQLSTSVLAGGSVYPRETYSADSFWQGSPLIQSAMPMANSVPSGSYLASSSMLGPQNPLDTRPRSSVRTGSYFASPSTQGYQILRDVQAKSVIQTSTDPSGQRLQSQSTNVKFSVPTSPHYAAPSMQGYQIPSNSQARSSAQPSPYLANPLMRGHQDLPLDTRARSTVLPSPHSSLPIQGYQVPSNERTRSSVQLGPHSRSIPGQELHSQPDTRTGSLVQPSCHVGSPTVQGLQSQQTTQAGSSVQTSTHPSASSSMQSQQSQQSQSDRQAKRSAETTQYYKPKRLRLPSLESQRTIVAPHSSQNDTVPKVDPGLDPYYQEKMEKIVRSSHYPGLVNFLKASITTMLAGSTQSPMDNDPSTTSRAHLGESNTLTRSTIPPTLHLQSEERQHQSNFSTKNTVPSSHQSRECRIQSTVAAENTIQTDVSSGNRAIPKEYSQNLSNILSGNRVPSSQGNEDSNSQSKEQQNQVNVAAESAIQSHERRASTSNTPKEHSQNDSNNPSGNTIPSNVNKDASLCTKAQEPRNQSLMPVDEKAKSSLRSSIPHDTPSGSQNLSKSTSTGSDFQAVVGAAGSHGEANRLLAELEVVSAENSIKYDADPVGMFADLKEFLKAQNIIKLASDEKDNEIESTDPEELPNQSDVPAEEDPVPEELPNQPDVLAEEDRVYSNISSLDRYVYAMSPLSEACFIDLDGEQDVNWSLSDVLPSLDDYSFATSPWADGFSSDLSDQQERASSLSTPETNASTISMSTTNQDRIERSSTNLPSLKRKNPERSTPPKPSISVVPKKPRKLITNIEKEDTKIKGDSAVGSRSEASEPGCSTASTSSSSHRKKNKTTDKSLATTNSDFDLSEFLVLKKYKRNR